MKFAKLSIAAIIAVGFSTSAVAAESGITVNPFGTAKLFYETFTNDGDDAVSLFDQGDLGDPALKSRGGSIGQARISGGATGNLNNCLGYGFEYMAVDTLGLENNLVSGVAMGADKRSNYSALDTQHWASQAYITYSPCDTFLSNTTFKIGRQYLDTPFAFTENWKIAPNSFDAAVIVNQDIVNTTLVAAYVGKGNGEFGSVTDGNDFGSYGYVNSPKGIGALPNVVGGVAQPGPLLQSATPSWGKGAYAIGAMTKLLDGALPLNVWAYDVSQIATAYWADAGYKADLAGVKLNLLGQYGFMTPDEDTFGATADDTSGFAIKAGTGMKVADMNFGLMAAYSTVDEDGLLPLANTATGFKKTKLATAGVYTDGVYVAQPGSDAFKVKASTKLAGIGSLAVQYINNENSNYSNLDVSEIDVILGTSLPGGIGAKLLYINRDHDSGLNNEHIRVVLSSKF